MYKRIMTVKGEVTSQ